MKLSKIYPILALGAIVLIFFWKYFLKGLLPIPSDIVVGLYFPWLDYKWGYIVGVPVKNNLVSDIVSVIYPFKMYAVEVLKAGYFPLWNPLSFCGAPLFANFQSGILYPLTLLYFLLPFKSAWSFQIIIQPFLMALFTYLYLRSLKIEKIASLLGGIIYAFSGFSIIWLGYNIHGHVAAFVPLFLLLSDKLFEDKRWGILLSLSIGVQFLAGYPQVTLYSFFLLAAYFLFRLFQKSKERHLFLKNLIYFGLFVALGLGLGAIQILPGWELLRASQRVAEGVPGGESLAFLGWPYLISFFAPDFFGNPTTGNFWGKGDYTNMIGYVGILTIILAVTAVICDKRKEKVFFGLSAILFLLYIFPTPLGFFLRKVNPFGLGAAIFIRAMAIVNLILAILAAFAFDLLWKNKVNKNVSRVPFYFLMALIGVTIGVFISRKMIFPYLEILKDTPEAVKIIQPLVTNLMVSLRNLILPTLLCFFSLAIFFLINIFTKLKRVFLVALFLVLILELFRFGWKYTSFTKTELVFPSTPVIDFLKAQKKPFRLLGGDVMPMNMWSAYGFESPAGYDAVYPIRYAKFLSAVNEGKLGKPLGRYGDIKNFKNPLLNLINVRYFLALNYDDEERISPSGRIAYYFRLPNLKSVFSDKSVTVLENTDVLPRAFLVYKYRSETNEEKIINALVNENFKLREEIILEEKIAGSLRVGKVNQVEYQEQINGESKVIIDHTGEGLLFVSDTYFPGWEAFIDGKKTDIYRADYTFRAIFVPPGRHTVNFIYRPQSFKIGGAISLFSLILLGGIFICETKNRRRTPS